MEKLTIFESVKCAFVYYSDSLRELKYCSNIFMTGFSLQEFRKNNN